MLSDLKSESEKYCRYYRGVEGEFEKYLVICSTLEFDLLSPKSHFRLALSLLDLWPDVGRSRKRFHIFQNPPPFPETVVGKTGDTKTGSSKNYLELLNGTPFMSIRYSPYSIVETC